MFVGLFNLTQLYECFFIIDKSLDEFIKKNLYNHIKMWYIKLEIGVVLWGLLGIGLVGLFQE